MPISRAQLEKELVPGLKSLIGLEYEQYGKQWSEIFEVKTTNRSFEEEAKLIGFGRAAEKPEGESVAWDEGAGETWSARYVARTFALGYILTQEAMEDNLYDSLGSRYSRQLGMAMAKTKEYQCANVLNFAFNSGVTGGDGVALCGSHPTASGATNSNTFAVGTDLNEATLENMVITMAQWVDERGLLIAVKPEKLVVPVGLQFIAKRILGTEGRPGTNDNDINALRSMGAIPGGYTVNNYLTDPDAFFLLTSVQDGLKLFQRTPLAKSGDTDFNTGNIKFKARERYSVGWTDPLAIIGSQGAS